MTLALFVWAMIGIAFWHFTVFVPDRFWGGIIGAFLTALAGALVSGFLLPQPGIPGRTLRARVKRSGAMPGAVVALLASYLYGAQRDKARGIVRD